MSEYLPKSPSLYPGELPCLDSALQDDSGEVFQRASQGLRGLIGLLSYLRPGLVTAGAVALPLVGWLATEYLVHTGFFVVALFTYDGVSSYRQWREVFVDGLGGGVAIGEGEVRPQGFSEDPHGGPRSIVMRQLPFWQWMRYKYTLRQDYLLSSAWRWGLHQLRSFGLDHGFTFVRRLHPRYQPFWGDPARELAELCLETSLCLGATRIDDETEGRRVATFCYEDWLCPADARVPNQILEVSRFSLRIDLKSRRALSCELNDQDIGTGTDALCYLYLALSGYHHTALHAYANWAAIPDHADPHVREGAVWTLATNAVALFTGRAFQDDPQSMKTVLAYNCTRGIPRHTAGAILRELAAHSRYTRFVYRARGALAETVKQHGLEIDVESLFLATVVHSLDHHMATLCVDPYDLVHTYSQHRAAQMVRMVFSEPLDGVLVNTKISKVKAGWPKTLYAKLQKLDADLAKQIDVGVSY